MLFLESTRNGLRGFEGPRASGPPGAVQMHGAQGASEAGTLETNKAPTTIATSRSSGNAPQDTDWARTIEEFRNALQHVLLHLMV